MRTIWHQAVKDVRANRLWLAVWLAILVVNATVYVLSPDRIVADARLWYASAFLQTAAQAALGWIIAIRIVIADPLDDTSAFWLTRPISPGALLASKFGLVSCIFLGAPATASMIVAAANGTYWSLLPRLALEWMAVDALLLWSLVLVASMTRDLARLFIAGMVAAYIFAGLRLSNSPVFSSMNPVLAFAVGFVALSGLIAHQYLTRRRLRTLLLGAAALGLALALLRLWPWPFLPGLTPGQVDPEVFDARPLVVTLDTSGSSTVLRTTRASEDRTAEVRGTLNVAGVRAGWVLRPLRGSGRIRFSGPSNDTVSSTWRTQWVTSLYDWNRADIPFEPEVVGFAVHASMIWPAKRRTPRDATVFTMPEAIYRRHVGASGQYDADIEFAAFQVTEAAAFPLLEGAGATVASETFTVARIRSGKNGDELGVRITIPRFVLPWRQPENYIVLRNRARGEAAMGWIRGGDTPGIGLAAASMAFGSIERLRNPSSDAGWLTGAEAVIVRAIDRGRFTVHVSNGAFVIPLRATTGG